MDILQEIEQSEHEFAQIMQERDRTDAYLTITKTMGPSPQLLAFVNHDNALSKELGVGLESMTPVEQHELLLSRLDINVLDTIAQENLAERVRKIGKYLVSGGIAAFLGNMLLTRNGFIGRLSLAAIVAGAITRTVTTKATKTFKFDVFTAMTRHFQDALKADLLIANGIPNDYEESSWETFRKNIVDKSSDEYKIAYNKDDEIHKKNMVAFDDSGWSETRYSAAVEWMLDNGKKIADLEKSFAKKVDKIEHYLMGEEGYNPKVGSHMGATLGMSMKLFHMSATLLSEVKHVLENVSHNFEEKEGSDGKGASEKTLTADQTNVELKEE